MMIETTINIGTQEFAGLVHAIAHAGTSRRGMVSAMLKYLAVKSRKCPAEWGRIKYQERRPGEEWKRLHVRLQRDEYEFFLDLKKVMKMSVSHLIAVAINLYMDEMLGELKCDVDSYRYRNYAMSKIFIEDVTCWIFYWGIPQVLLEPPVKKIE